MTLRTRLTGAFLLVVLVPLLVASAVVLGVLPRTAQDALSRSLGAQAGLAVASIAERCARVTAAAEAAAQAASRGPSQAALEPALQRLVDGRLLDGVRVVSQAGRDLAKAGTPPTTAGRGCEDSAAVRTAGGAQLAVRLPLTGADGSAAGAVLAAVAVDDDYARELRAAAGVGEVVLLADERVVARSGPVPDALVRAGVRGAGEGVPIDGRLAVALTADSQPLGVLVTAPLDRSRLPMRWLVPLLVVGAALLAGLIGSGLARATTRPLQELGRAARRVAEGDLTTTLVVRSRDEVGQLAETFNVMTDELRVHVAELEKSRDELQAGVARLGQALSGTHDLDRILGVVLDAALASTRARAGAVLLRDPQSDSLALSVGRNLETSGVPTGLRVPMDEGIAGAVARSGRPARGRSGTGPGELRPGPGEPTGVPLAAVALSSSDRVVGVLLLWDREEEFAEADLATLQTFTSQATVAVDNVLLHDEARRLSLTDELSGLWNYRYFTMTVGKEIERAARFSRPLALLLLDLDHFKLVNDVWGHQRGDAVLVELAGRVRAQVRDVDTLARYGGEEFVVVLPETDAAGAVQAAQRIGAAVRRRPFGEDDERPIDVTVSIGVAVFPDHGTTSTTLLRRADEALYAAKRGGRDTWRAASADPATALEAAGDTPAEPVTGPAAQATPSEVGARPT